MRYPQHNVFVEKIRKNVFRIPCLIWSYELGSHPTEYQEVAGLSPAGQQHSFTEIDHEIFSMFFLSLFSLNPL